MIRPRKYLHLDYCVINVSSIIIQAFTHKSELTQNEIDTYVFANLGKDALPNIPYAIDFLFLNGRLYYVESTQKFVFSLVGEYPTQKENLFFEIERLKLSIKEPYKFDLEKVKQLFEQCQIYFSESLAKSYEQLLDFNKKITSERNSQILDSIKEKTMQLDE